MESMPSSRLIEEFRHRLAEIHADIAAAAAHAGRRAEEIRLVAVSKTQPAEVLAAAVAAGVREIGENYIQEAVDKFRTLGWTTEAPVVRHAIGHLQANKARKAAMWFDMLETIDSLELAQRLDRVAEELGRTLPVLLEINICGDTTKSGFFSSEVEGVLPSLAKCSSIRVQGLMTIGRLSVDPEGARADFRALRVLRDHLQSVAPPSILLHELSMGMSHDFPVAVEEGATIVRVGSRIFGPRHSS